MVKCRHCSREVGFLRSAHKECEQAHSAGVERILELSLAATAAQAELASAKRSILDTASSAFVKPELLTSLLVRSYESAVSSALDDGVLTQQEEDALDAYAAEFGLSQEDLDVNDAYTRLVKGGVLRDLLEGKVPERITIQGTLPFNFQRGEQLVWLFQEVPYHEPRSRTTYSGGYSGVSLRVAKGVYYRVGGFRGNPVVTTQMAHIDTGLLGVTTRHVYFTGGSRSFRINYRKIVSISPFTDGVAIQRDAASAKPQVFITGDGWFTHNLLTNLATAAA